MRCATCGEENPARARYCLACGASLAEPAASDETRRLVTVLFCDLVGSTAMGERWDAEVVRSVLAAHFSAVRNILERHGGTVEKFIGDAVVAIFGVPQAHEDDALRAVRAALEIKASVAPPAPGKSEIALDVRIGINSGEVVTGGDLGRDVLTTGDVVNTAARLEAAAAPGEIVLGDATWRLVRDGARATRLPPLAVKGKVEPLVAHRLDALAPGAAMRPARTDTPLAGRIAELDAIVGAIEATIVDRTGHQVILLGDPGMGKSRLVAEAVSRVAPSVQWLHGGCLAYGEGITFWPMREIVHQAARVDETDDRAMVTRKVRALVAGRPDAAVLTRLLTELIGVAPARGARDELLWAGGAVLRHLAMQKPTVVVIEDLHWAEDTLLDLLDRVITTANDVPLGIVLTARPEFADRRPDLLTDDVHRVVLRLGPLADGGVAELVTSLGGADLDAATRARIAAAAGGNPFFVEQLFAMFAQGEGLDIPPTIGALLAARLDLLDADDRREASHASVVGRTFDEDALADLSADRDPKSIADTLDALVRRDVLDHGSPARAPVRSFAFRHILMRDAAYLRLAKRERARLHARFAHWLEVFAGDRRTEYEEILGYHLEQSWRYRTEISLDDDETRRIGDRAAAYLWSSAMRAWDRADGTTALGLFQRAKQVAAPDAWLEFAPLMIKCVWNHVDDAAAAVLLQEAEAAAERINPRLSRRVALTRLEFDVNTRTDMALGSLVGRVTDLIADYEADGDPEWVCRGWAFLAWVRSMLGDESGAVAAAREAYALAISGGPQREVMRTRGMIAWSAGFGPMPADEGVALLEGMLAGVDDSPFARSMLLQPLAVLVAMRGDVSRARAICEEDMALSQALQIPIRTMTSNMIRANVEDLAEEPAAALHFLRASYEDRDADMSMRASLEGEIAAHLAKDGVIAEAEEHLSEARQIALPDDQDAQARWRMGAARVALSRDDYGEARRLATEAVDLFAPTDWLALRGLSWRVLAEIELAAGDRAAARVAAEAARDAYGRKGSVISVASTDAFLGSLGT